MNSAPIVKWALLIAFFWLAALALYAASIVTRHRALVSAEKLFGKRLSEQDFEAHLARGFRHRGYLAEGSQGSYLVIRRGGEVTLVSYQGWDQPYLVKKRVMQLRRAMQLQGAAGGKLVCGFVLPRRIEESLRAGAIDCIGPKELKELLTHETAHDVARDADPVTSFHPDAAAGPVTVPRPEQEPVHLPEPHPPGAVPRQSVEHRPLCPRCNSEMELAIAAGGGADGQRFWRCVRAPQCKGIRSAASSLQHG
jgi:hypothetical protein